MFIVKFDPIGWAKDELICRCISAVDAIGFGGSRFDGAAGVVALESGGAAVTLVVTVPAVVGGGCVNGFGSGT